MIQAHENVDEVKFVAVGFKVIDALNFSLFNACPTKQKAYWIYKTLLKEGYPDRDFEDVFLIIKDYFKNRTKRNQEKLFMMYFNIPPSKDIFRALELNYRTAAIQDTQIESVANYVWTEFNKTYSCEKVGLKKSTLFYAIKKMYKPSHSDEDRNFDIWDLRYRVKNHLLQNGLGDASLESILNYISLFNPKGREHLIASSAIKESDKNKKGHSESTDEKYSAVVQKHLETSTPEDKDESGKHLNDDENYSEVHLNYGEYEWLIEIKESIGSGEYSQIPELRTSNPGRLPHIRKIMNGIRKYNSLISSESIPMNKLEYLDKLKSAILIATDSLISTQHFNKSTSDTKQTSNLN